MLLLGNYGEVTGTFELASTGSTMKVDTGIKTVVG
jgi:hypothetical protein